MLFGERMRSSSRARWNGQPLRPFGGGNSQTASGRGRQLWERSASGHTGYRDLVVRLRYSDDDEFADSAEELAEAVTRVNMQQIQDYELPGCPGCGDVEYVQPQRCDFIGARGGSLRGTISLGVSKQTQRCTAAVMRTPNSGNCQLVTDALGMYESRRGTCFELAAERAARLRLGGEDARVVVEQERIAGKNMLGQYHAYVIIYDDAGVPIAEEDPAEDLRNCAGGGTCTCDQGNQNATPNPGVRDVDPGAPVEIEFRRGYDDGASGVYSPGADCLHDEALVAAYQAGHNAGREAAG